jgi:hypothetical protein
MKVTSKVIGAMHLADWRSRDARDVTAQNGNERETHGGDRDRGRRGQALGIITRRHLLYRNSHIFVSGYNIVAIYRRIAARFYITDKTRLN